MTLSVSRPTSHWALVLIRYTLCCADIYVISFIEFKYKSHEFWIFSSYINFEVCTRKTLRIQNDLGLVPPISGRMYARSPIWSWGGATGYWGGAKSRSSSPPQAPTTTGVRLSAPTTDPSARPCLECRKSLRRISRQTEFEFDCTWILRFSLHHLNVAIHHEQTKLIELLKNIKFEILKFNRDSPDF